MIKKEKKSRKLNPTDYNLLIVKDLWQAHYQILLVIMLKVFTKWNVNTGATIKKYENCIIKYKYYDCFLEYIHFKDNLIEYKCLCCNMNYQKKKKKKKF